MDIIKLTNYVPTQKGLKYGSQKSACFDLTAGIKEPILLLPSCRAGVPTGIKMSPKDDCWLRINSRSGLALKHGIIAIAGIIDNDYRGEIIVALLNTNPPKDVVFINDDKFAEIKENIIYLNNTGKKISINSTDIAYGETLQLKNKIIEVKEYGYIINSGDRIAQAEICKTLQQEINFVEELEETKRGDGGFGSTGE